MQVDFRVVKASYFQQVDADAYWPADIRWIRDALTLKRGTPRFIVAAGGKVLIHQFGQASWEASVHPLILKLVSEKARKP